MRSRAQSIKSFLVLQIGVMKVISGRNTGHLARRANDMQSDGSAPQARSASSDPGHQPTMRETYKTIKEVAL